MNSHEEPNVILGYFGFVYLLCAFLWYSSDYGYHSTPCLSRFVCLAYSLLLKFLSPYSSFLVYWIFFIILDDYSTHSTPHVNWFVCIIFSFTYLDCAAFSTPYISLHVFFALFRTSSDYMEYSTPKCFIHVSFDFLLNSCVSMYEFV